MRGGGDGGRGLVVHFKWISLILVAPSPKHYDASVTDLRFSSAPNTSTDRAHQLLCLLHKS